MEGTTHTHERHEPYAAFTERADGPSLAEPGGDEALTGKLALSGESGPMWHLRRQMQILGPHLRGALVEAEAGLGGETIARELHRLSEFSALSLIVADAQEAPTQGDLPRGDRLTILVRGLPGCSLALQRWWMQQIQGSRKAGIAMQWLVLAEHSAKQLVAAGSLVPEVARVLPPVTLRVPPLRERLDDLGILAPRILRSFGAAADRVLHPDVMHLLEAHTWPGNLHELIRCLRAWYATGCDTAETLAPILQQAKHPATGSAPVDARDEEPLLLQTVIDRHLLRTMRRCGGNKLRAAEMLGVSRSTLYRMLEGIAGETRALEGC